MAASLGSKRGVERPLTEYRHEAIAALDRAYEAPVPTLIEQTDFAQRAIVHIRDVLIDSLRAVPPDDRASRYRTALNQINQIISLVCAVEYPAVAIEREHLKEARRMLESISDSDLLS